MTNRRGAYGDPLVTRTRLHEEVITHLAGHILHSERHLMNNLSRIESLPPRATTDRSQACHRTVRQYRREVCYETEETLSGRSWASENKPSPRPTRRSPAAGPKIPQKYTRYTIGWRYEVKRQKPFDIYAEFKFTVKDYKYNTLNNTLASHSSERSWVDNCSWQPPTRYWIFVTLQ